MIRMFVGTWNVGGKSPHEGLDLKDWLKSPAEADIYVLGYAYNHINFLLLLIYRFWTNYIPSLLFCLDFKKSCR